MYTGKISPPFYFRPLSWRRNLNLANWNICGGLWKKIWEWANSRPGKSVLDLYRVVRFLAYVPSLRMGPHGKEVKDVFGRPGACVRVGSAR